MKISLALLLLALTASPTLAETQDDVLAATMLSGWQMPDGHYMTGLNLTLAPHWKTYWRAPGETGIPPQFDWSGSTNVKAVSLHWPSPEVIVLNGMQSIGYFDRLVLPVEVTAADPSKPVELHLQMRMGICKDICMPASVSVGATLTGPGEHDAQIAAALAAGPITDSAAGLTAIHCDVTAINDGLHIQAQLALPQQGSPETVVFESGDASVWVATASSDRNGPLLTAATDMVPQAGAPFVLDRSAVTVTVIGQDHSVEIKGCPAP